jgi:hypothetical protein
MRGLAWLAAAAVVLTLTIAVQQQHRAAVKVADPRGGHISDFDRWMLMTPRFLHEHADYVNDDLPTPPISLIVFAPFAAMSRPHAQFVWVCAKLPAALLVFFLAAAIVARAGVRLTPAAIAGRYVAQRERLRSDLGAGALIGLGVAMKVTPVIFVAYALWKRRWLLAASSIVSVGLWSLCVPAVVFGWEQSLRWFGQWARIMIVPFVAQGKVVYATSQSVPSFALRLLTMTPAFESHQGGVTEGHYMNVLALDNVAVRQIVRVVMAAAAAAGLWWTRRPLRTLRSRRYVFEIAAVAAFMLWFSERTWIHHYVSFILMLAAAGMILSDPAQPESARRPVRIALAAFAAISFFASDAGKLLGRDGIDWAKAIGVYLWPSVIVTVAVLRAAAGPSASRESGAIT